MPKEIMKIASIMLSGRHPPAQKMQVVLKKLNGAVSG
jgi:hypothetical protein